MQITEIITEIITDETLREIREHGTPEFPFEYYLDDIDEIGQGYVEWHWHNEIEWSTLINTTFR